MWKNASLIYYLDSIVMRFTWCLQCQTNSNVHRFTWVVGFFWWLSKNLYVENGNLYILLFGVYCYPILCTLLATFCLPNRPETMEERIKQINGISIVTEWIVSETLKMKIGTKCSKDARILIVFFCSFLHSCDRRLLFFLFVASGWFQRKTFEWKIELTTNDYYKVFRK